VLRGGDVHEQMLKYIPDYVTKIVNETVNTDAMPEQWDEVALNAALQQKVYPDECKFEITHEMLEKWDYEYAINKISKEVVSAYEEKIVNISKETNNQVDYHQVERNELLRAVDKNWIDHIDAMDQLRKGIGLRGYAQQDPVIAYKQEGHDMFEEMIERIQTTTISRLLKGKIIKVNPMAQRIPFQQPVRQAGANGNIPNGNMPNPAAKPMPNPAAQPRPNVQRQAINIPLDTLPQPKPINAEGDFVPKGTIIHRPRTETENKETANKDTENKDTDNTNK
jgi:preprotein translocase subunit SecA